VLKYNHRLVIPGGKSTDTVCAVSEFPQIDPPEGEKYWPPGEMLALGLVQLTHDAVYPPSRE
jgi:hypothetical protein